MLLKRKILYNIFALFFNGFSERSYFMKKLLALLLTACTLVSLLGGCGNTSSSNSETSGSNESSVIDSSQSSTTDSSQSSESDFVFIDEEFDSATDYDTTKITAGLTAMGIDSSYKIAILDTDELVVNTAAENLQKFFAKVGLSIEIIDITAPGENQIILTLNGASDAQSTLFTSNNLSVVDVSADEDAFHLKKVGSNIIVAGSNPRGVLYGVYDLEDHITYTSAKPLDSFVTWAFKTRSGGLGYYWSGGDFLNETYFEEKAEYLSRLGINMYCPVVDGSGVPTRISTFVKSTIFPFQNDPLETSIAQLEGLSNACAKYGIDFYQWLTEPALPHLLGPTDQYPEGTLGLTELPASMSEAEGKTLCIHNETVQAYLREQVHSFIERFPNVKGFFIYNNDCDSYLCIPEWCDNCKKIVTANTASKTAWELLAKTVTVFTEAAHEVDEDFRVMFLPAIHNQNSADVTRLVNQTKYTDIAIASDAFDHNPTVPKHRSEYIDICLNKDAEDATIKTFMYQQITRSESVPQNFLYAVSAAKSIQTFKKWGFENIMDTTGPTPSTNNFNAIVMKYMLRNPSQDYNELIRRLCIEQLGTEAGDLMYQASEKIGKGMELWGNNNQFNSSPFRGSHNEMSIGTIMNIMPETILPSSVGKAAIADNILKMWNATSSRMWEAMELLKEAVSKASDEQYVKYAYYSDEIISRPTSKEYAELQYATTVLGAYYAKFRNNSFEAKNLLNQVSDYNKVSRGIDDGSDAFDQYIELVKTDKALQQELADLITEFINNGNYIVKSSLTEFELNQIKNNALKKITQYNNWLDDAGIE